MAITVGNYIIRSAIGEDNVLMVASGSTSNYAQVISGAFTEPDNRCYWRTMINSSIYNGIYNVRTWTSRGYVTARTIAAGSPLLQRSYDAKDCLWIAELSGNTMVVNGQNVQTYLLKSKKDETMYWTVPEDGGNLFLSTLMEDTTCQEFYFEPSTWSNFSLATPTALTTSNNTDYIIDEVSGTSDLVMRWKSSSTNRIYEERYRSRLYDPLGIPGEWTPWTGWQLATATKTNTKQIMQRDSAISTPAVDNQDYMQADIQVEERITNVTRANQYTTTGSVAHGRAVSGLIRKWTRPTLNLTAATCKRYGLSIEYNCNYTIAGNTINIIKILNGPEKLVENYILTSQDYQGEIIIPWDVISTIPSENNPIDITVEYTESNGIVSIGGTYTLNVAYGPEFGYPFTPTYSLTDRMTIEATIDAYDSVECYIQRLDLLGNVYWASVEEIVKSDTAHRFFDIPQPFGVAPTIMWVVSHSVNGNIQWGYRRETLSDAYIINTKYYVWNWVDDAKAPHAFILKYRAGEIVQPMDVISLSATKFVTTGRDYPVFRYGRSVDRQLDVDGSILIDENGLYSTKEIAETLSKADHAVYRQPNGKWYQVALKTVSFSREKLYHTIQIQQEAETR